MQYLSNQQPMTDVDDLKDKYFIQADDASPPERPEPPTYEDSSVEALLDGAAYYSDLQAEIDQLESGDFLYLAGWLMDLIGFFSGDWGEGASGSAVFEATDDFALTPDSDPLRIVLREKSEAGVDVRVLPWFSWSLIDRHQSLPSIIGDELEESRLGAYLDVNRSNALVADNLRGVQALQKSCCLNILSHPVGAVHAKLVVLGDTDDSIAYTGGLDLSESRRDSTMHPDAPENDPDADRWGYHDVQAKVRGPAVQDCYDLFRQMWNEILDMWRGKMQVKLGDDTFQTVIVNTYERGTDEVPDRDIGGAIDSSSLHLQSLRTLPVLKSLPLARELVSNDLSFTAEDAGLFTVEHGWLKAIDHATEYLYMEDQYLWSHDIMSAIGSQMQAESSLKVILVGNSFNRVNEWALWEGIVSQLSDDELDRLRVFARDAIMVHSKTTLIDDEWALIGSANCARRSLYTDFEQSYSIIDPDGSFLPDYRCDLWGDNFRMDVDDRSSLANLDEALHIWNDDWGTDSLSVTRPDTLIDVTDQISERDMSGLAESIHDTVRDPDSRETSGGVFL